MAGNGLWAELSCKEAPDGKGGVDIKVDGSTRPVDPKGGGTTTTISGVMHSDGSVEGELIQRDNGAIQMLARTDGTGVTSVPLPTDKSLSDVARESLTPPAQACKRSLGTVPGVSG
jgi:hypothetical protein